MFAPVCNIKYMGCMVTRECLIHITHGAVEWVTPLSGGDAAPRGRAGSR